VQFLGQSKYFRIWLSKNKLLSESFWALSGNIVFRGLSLLSGIVIARILGADVYGEYGIIKNTLIYMGFFSTFGLGYTSTKFIAEYKNSRSDYVVLVKRYTTTITFIISIVFMVFLFIVADYFAERGLSAHRLKVLLRILSALIIFSALTTTQTGIIAGLGKFKELAIINAIVGVITFFLSLCLTYFFNLNGALGALLITQILNCVFNDRLIRKCMPKNIIITKNRKILSEIFSFSTPVALQESIYYLTTWLCSYLLIRLSSFGALGLYNAAMQWNSIILFIPAVLRNVILTNLSETINNQTRHSMIIKTTLLISFLITFTLSLFVFLLAPHINHLYGTSYNGLDKLIGVAVLITVFGSMSDIYAQAYMSEGMTWLMFFIRLLRDAGTIILFLVLMKSDSFLAAKSLIYSNLIMYVVFLFIMLVAYNNKSKIKYIKDRRNSYLKNEESTIYFDFE
jgi:O-antigen/teichoic acid export membrane protein